MGDFFTNSHVEGIRCEGFLSPPPALLSEDPLNDLRDVFLFNERFQERATRLALQRMETWSLLLMFFDFRKACEDTDIESCLGSAEYTELAELAVVRKAAALLRACDAVPVPQKWVGSSIGVVADAGAAPPRDNPEIWIDEHVSLKLFDWGRSELNTAADHALLTQQEIDDRQCFWKMYQESVGHFLWECSRLYWNNFCHQNWTSVKFNIYDFDSATENDFMGCAVLDLVESEEVVWSTLQIFNNGNVVCGEAGYESKVTIGVSYVKTPKPSRIQGVWRIHVKSAAYLPVLDPLGSSDPFVIVSLHRSVNGVIVLSQVSAQTCVISTNLNPEWNEIFEFATVWPENSQAEGIAGESAFRNAVQLDSTLSCELLAAMLEPCGCTSVPEMEYNQKVGDPAPFLEAFKRSTEN